MTTPKIVYLTKRYYIVKASAASIGMMLLCGVVLFCLYRFTSIQKNAIVFGYILSVIIFIALAPRIRNKFTVGAKIIFDEDGFKLSNETNLLAQSSVIKWSDISSYRVSFSNKQPVLFLKLYLRNGKNVSYSFWGEGGESVSMKTKSLLSLYFAYVRNYNAGRQLDEQIDIQQGLLKGMPGKIIFCISFLNATCSIFWYLGHRGNFPYIYLLISLASPLWMVLVHFLFQKRYERLSVAQPLPFEMLAESVQ